MNSALPVVSRELAYLPPGVSLTVAIWGMWEGNAYYYANESKISGCAVPDMKMLLQEGLDDLLIFFYV